ncbi:uncharacterized protein LOC110379276 [Helicoverpa armigera]|uniref:uncharacterized protein LOC110379276 n=1 Tax=Helicoverpa armigera TaxID=29058 RepID=UPI0030838676
MAPEAIPMRDITADTVAKAMYEGWISRFGCPLRVTTDQGRQFESALFKALMKKFGITRIRTTAFHPQANEKVERWHRKFKSRTHGEKWRSAGTHWSEELATVLLGLRSALREDSQVSPALMTYGSTLRIPSDFFEPSPPEIEDAEFVRCLSESMANLSPSNKSHSNNRNTFVYKDLATCTHVFVRNDMVKSPLTPPYDGPFEVIHRGEKQFTIQMPLRTAVVSIDRLKPAYLLNEEEITPTSSSMQNKQQASPSRFPSIVPQPAAAAKPQRDTIVTRSGRTVKPNVRFA